MVSCGWLLSLSRMFSWFIYVVLCVQYFFSFPSPNSQAISQRTDTPHLLIPGGLLGCFCLVAIISNTPAMNTPAQVFCMGTMSLPREYSSERNCWAAGSLCLMVPGPARLSSKVAHPFTCPSAMYSGSRFFLRPCQHLLFPGILLALGLLCSSCPVSSGEG